MEVEIVGLDLQLDELQREWQWNFLYFNPLKEGVEMVHQELGSFGVIPWKNFQESRRSNPMLAISVSSLFEGQTLDQLREALMGKIIEGLCKVLVQGTLRLSGIAGEPEKTRMAYTLKEDGNVVCRLWKDVLLKDFLLTVEEDDQNHACLEEARKSVQE